MWARWAPRSRPSGPLKKDALGSPAAPRPDELTPVPDATRGRNVTYPKVESDSSILQLRLLHPSATLEARTQNLENQRGLTWT